MAIKNAILGGKDFTAEALHFEDLNDTFDVLHDWVM